MQVWVLVSSGSSSPVVESVLTSCLTVCVGSCTVDERRTLETEVKSEQETEVQIATRQQHLHFQMYGQNHYPPCTRTVYPYPPEGAVLTYLQFLMFMHKIWHRMFRFSVFFGIYL